MTRLLFILGCVYITLRTAKDQNIFIMNQYIKGCTFSFYHDSKVCIYC